MGDVKFRVNGDKLSYKATNFSADFINTLIHNKTNGVVVNIDAELIRLMRVEQEIELDPDREVLLISLVVEESPLLTRDVWLFGGNEEVFCQTFENILNQHFQPCKN